MVFSTAWSPLKGGARMASDASAQGLTSAEAAARLGQYGPNQVREDKPHPLRQFAKKLWGPVPWMLEITFILEFVLHKTPEAIIIALLLVFNAVLGFMQEQRAQGALDLLRSQLKITARVLRDGAWREVAASEIVPGDYLHLRMGDFAPADITVTDGTLLVDQSALTGEAAPVDRGVGELVYSGSVIRRGEASGTVKATGSQSYFGKTAELVRGAGARSHLEDLVMGIVRYLVLMDGALVAGILLYATIHGMGLADIAPFALILLVASVPVALPATFTLATAIASLDLAHHGVLVTRLAAIEEVSAMDELCTDKTGTLTQNQLTLSEARPVAGVSMNELLTAAALACDTATQDPLDLAILKAAAAENLPIPTRTTFTPFDPATKRSAATFTVDGQEHQAIKGAPQIVGDLAGYHDWTDEAAPLAATGARLLAVAAGPTGKLAFLGLLALADPPRADAAEVIQSLQNLGVRVRMVTGDSIPTAQAVAAQLGIAGPVCDRTAITAADKDCGVFAGVFPEDKFHIVQQMQKRHRITGMTGDGVNDAPALKQAEVGIAVSTAMDVAKAAASLVLTRPGLTDVVTTVKTGRLVYQRMLTYTLNKIVKTFQVALFLSLGLLLFGQFVVTPLLVLLLLFANDFVTMSLAGDHVHYSPEPDHWDLSSLVGTSLVVAGAWLVYIFAVFAVGQFAFHWPIGILHTMDFLGLVFSGLANVMVVRERSWLWASRPGRFLALATLGDLLAVSALAYFGILMHKVSGIDIGVLLLFTMAYMVLLDIVKVPVLGYFHQLRRHHRSEPAPGAA